MSFVVENGVRLMAGNKSVSIQSVPKYLPEQIGILIYDNMESEVRKANSFAHTATQRRRVTIQTLCILSFKVAVRFLMEKCLDCSCCWPVWYCLRFLIFFRMSPNFSIQSVPLRQKALVLYLKKHAKNHCLFDVNKMREIISWT